MNTEDKSDILIIGAGVIGLAAALRLAAGGRDVTVIDPNEPGSGASYGNAGTIADYAVIPVGTPAVLKNLPSLLFSRDSPLSIRYSAILSLVPWLLRFAYQSLPANAARNATVIAGLLAESLSGWRELASQAGAGDLLRQNGCLYLFDDPKAFAATAGDFALREKLGISQERLTADTVARLEPELPAFEGGAVLFPDAVNLTDPARMMQRLTKAAEAQGVRFLKTAAIGIERGSGAVSVVCTEKTLRARTVIIAAGAHSKRLAAAAGDRIPLDTERGYHVEYDMAHPIVSRPVCPVSRGFYLVPMSGRLRVAGTVELGGLAAPLNPQRIRVLECGANAIFPNLGTPDRQWLGFRPSIPDSIPVIGPSRYGNDVIYAFGHGHLGLTLAPVTAHLVQQVAEGRDLSPIAHGVLPHRFR